MAHVWIADSSETGVVAGLLVEFRDWWGRSEPSAERFEAGVARLIHDPATEYLLGSPSRGERAAGVCQLRYRHGVWFDAEDAWLEDLFVRSEARGSGLGRALAEAAAARARERGCARIELDVNESNPVASALYESLGFSAVSDPPGGRNLKLTRAL